MSNDEIVRIRSTLKGLLRVSNPSPEMVELIAHYEGRLAALQPQQFVPHHDTDGVMIINREGDRADDL